ncbi:1-phosphatidylinositol 3-phosphate 5-kinase isoform X2 [Octopus sinensis]|uniref:1-phosphatidylinositol-3-phosphate 5-kinase n=1 Tax=Octopus sinensis TaxID=2607531 RepID=A0A7E6F2P1_9MOLL|nr:1-phosphatidylinositol 3-phosphate 5-kinase isoform X2 [Octopus sinensis]
MPLETTTNVPDAQSNSPSPANEPSEETAVENVSAVKQCPLKTESNTSSPETEEESSVSEDAELQTKHPDSPMNPQRRSLTSVLSRISSILDRGSSKESDFKQYWMPDSSCRECYDCGDKFTTLRRRHHCRICGQIFCSKCCNQELPGKIMGHRGGVRVCEYCCRAVTTYTKQQGSTSGDLQNFKDDLKNLNPLQSGESLPPANSGSGGKDSGWWTPVLQKRYTSSIMDEQIPHGRSHSSPDITNGESNKVSAPFDLTHQPEFASIENIANESKKLTQNSLQLRELWRHIQHPKDGVEMQSHRFRLKTYQHCVTGKELVEWLLRNGKAAKRVQAVAIGQALIDASYLESVCRQLSFFQDDYTLYKPGEAANALEQTPPPNMPPCVETNFEPSWLKEINNKEYEDESINISLSDDQQVSNFFGSQKYNEGDLYVHANHFDSSQNKTTTTKPRISENKKSSSSDLNEFDALPKCRQELPDDFLTGTLFVSKSGNAVEPIICAKGWRSTEELREKEDCLAYDRLRKVHKEHLSNLVRQLLNQEGLPLSWEGTIMQTAHKVSQFVSPDVRNEGDDMDIRKYVQIKKISGGQRNQTAVIHGVVCSKNVAHKKMQTTVSKPKILLLKGAIDYQRVENKFSSLEPLILQEREFLKNSVAKVCALKPDVVVVEKSVCRLAQEFLLEAGIILIFNTKTSVMQRLSRCTQAEIVRSIDGLVNKPKLGFCNSFKVKNFQLPNGHTKTLLYFDDCAKHLACTVTLRGSHNSELKRVKKIMQFMTYAAYHSQLEVSFIMDEFGLPPPSGDEIGLNLDTDISDVNSELRDSQQDVNSEQKDVIDNRGHVFNNQCRRDAFKTASSMTLSLQLVEEVGDTDVVDSEPSEKDIESSKEDDPSLDISTEVSQSSDNKLCKDVMSNSRKQPGIEELTDFSDPLHNYLTTKDDSIFHSSVALQEQKVAQQQKIRKALEDLVLSVSPYIKIDPPYLETTNGLKSTLRKYFPDEMYFSPALSEKNIDNRPKYFDTDVVSRISNKKNVEITEAHPFIMWKLEKPVKDPSVQDILSDFRARGGRIKTTQSGSCYHDECKEVAKKTSNGEIKNDINYVSFYYDQKRDCLDLYSHQHLSVLFSSFSSNSSNAPNPCVNPWIVTMEFYGKNDVTLGGFLERFCFRESYVCPSKSCDTPMVDHVRRFVHENSCITVDLRKLDRIIPGAEKNIFMWSRCRKCKQVTPLGRMTMDTWNMSFSKYLELRFHGSMYKRRVSAEPCNHSLHHDHCQYFGYKDIVAYFKYSTVSLCEVALPSIVVEYHHQPCFPAELNRRAVSLSHKGMDLYNAIWEQTIKLQNDYSLQQNQSKILTDYLAFQKSERASLNKHADEIHQKLQLLESLSKKNSEGKFENEEVCFSLSNQIADSLTSLTQMVAEAVVNWNAKIQDFLVQKKEKSKTQSPAVKEHQSSLDVVDNYPASVQSFAEGSYNSTLSNSPHHTPQVEAPDIYVEEESADSQASSGTTISAASSSPLPIPQDDKDISVNTEVDISDRTSATKDTLLVGNLDSNLNSSPKSDVPFGSQESSSPGNVRDERDGKLRVVIRDRKYNTDDIGNEEQEKKRTVLSRIPGFRTSTGNMASLRMPFEAHEHPLLAKCERIPVIVYDTEPSSIIAYALSSRDYHCRLQEIQSQLGSVQRDSPSASPEHQRRNLKAENARNLPLKTSTVGLNSNPEQGSKHSGVLDFLRGSTSKERSPKLTHKFDLIDIVRYNPKLDADSVESGMDVNDGSSSIPVDGEKSKPCKVAINPHIDIQFSDSSSRFYCRVHFAEHFRQLRSLVFPAGEDVFIRSMNHCQHWSAKGGKSRSAFSKTCDNRFILKQMSNAEAVSFQVFAPNYFQYITKAYLEQKPTVLAKILGVYTIGFRNNQTSTVMKQDLLVMENLLYNRKVSQTFDLKGSVRNRLVNLSGKQEEEVLLDQNFLQVSVDSPLYIRPHSKAVLAQAIDSDSKFLASNFIMDYSLLVGQDDQMKELVVGIIDYIRTFTWDKKLEMVVKATGFLGGASKMPTVVFPELYKSRFLEAMDRYFPPVPDRWSGLGYGLDY